MTWRADPGEPRGGCCGKTPLSLVQPPWSSSRSLGFVDYATGPDLAFSPLYLVLLCAAAWRLRTRYGFALAVVCTAVWETADVLSGEVYSSPIVSLWNTTTRLFTYVLVVLLLTRLRHTLRSSGRLAVTCPLTAAGDSTRQCAKRWTTPMRSAVPSVSSTWILMTSRTQRPARAQRR